MLANRTWGWVVTGVLVVSLLGSIAARFFGRPQLVVPLGVPALILTGWAFFGHLVTLDDDAPGGWSNPERSRKTWLSSLAILAGLLLLFGVACWVVLR